MASAAATSTMAHSMPPVPMSMTSAPRIRPPRIPKGTPNANTNPQPEGPKPRSLIWVQGKWRDPASNAVKQRQQIYSRRVEKALRHEVLGANIYAYNHIRTKQVVYSLTRNMDNTNIMKQLQYHGKKTVPAAIRRDMWTPYFSVHFPATDFGVESGKLAYQRLRELSLQRQLSPPKDMVTTTQEDIDKMKLKTNPVDMKTMLEEREIRLPVVGQRLPKKMRAKRLMDQKATAVADVAFVLKLYLEGGTPEERREMRVAKFRERMSNMGRRAKSRLQKIRLLEARKRDYINALASQVHSMSSEEGHLTLDKHTAARISSEYQGEIRKDGGLGKLASIEKARTDKATEAALRGNIADVQAQIDALLTGQPIPKNLGVTRSSEPFSTTKPDTAAISSEEQAPASEDTKDISTIEDIGTLPTVKIMWADMRDGTYASEWPESVLHGELERWAASARAGGQRQRNIHVIGAEEGTDWAGDPKEVFTKLPKRDADHERRVKVDASLTKSISFGKGDILEMAIEYTTSEQERRKPRLERARENSRTHKSIDLMAPVRAELRARLEAAGVSAAEQKLTSAALEWHWENLNDAQTRNVNKETALLQAQILMLSEGQQETALPSVAQAKGRERAKYDAEALREKEGVEVDLPKSGLFDRLKALIWKR